jgi:hypothetical protein
MFSGSVTMTKKKPAARSIWDSLGVFFGGSE